MSLRGLGALAGGAAIGYERQERLQMDQERNDKTGKLMDLQIAEAKRKEDEAARNQADEDYSREVMQKYFNERNPQLDKTAPEAPYRDDEGNDLPADQISGAGIKARDRATAPARDEWAVRKDMIDATKQGMNALLQRGNRDLYQKASKQYGEMRHLYRADLANHVYDAVTRGDMENAHSKLAEMYGMIDDGGEVKQHGVTGDGKKFYADVEKDGKVTRHEYTPEEFRHMAGRFASPDMMAYDQAAASAAFEKGVKLRTVGAQERNAEAGIRRADALEKNADTNATVGSARVRELESRADKNDRWAPGGSAAAGKDPAKIREARVLVEEGIEPDMEAAYRRVSAGTGAADRRANGIRGYLALKNNLTGQPLDKTYAEAEAAYDKAGAGIKPAAPGATPPRSYDGFSAQPVR